MKNHDMPKLTKYMYAVLYLINKVGAVEKPRRMLPKLVKSELKLSDTASNLRKKNGQFIYEDRTGWALTFLKKAELIDFPKSGKATITQSGKEYLKTCHNDGEIKIQKLLSIPEFVEFYKSKKKKSASEHMPTHVGCDDVIVLGNNSSINIMIDKQLFPDVLRDLLGSGYTLTKRDNELTIIKHS